MQIWEQRNFSYVFLFACFSFLFVCFLAFQMTFLMRLGYNVIMSLKNVLSLKLEQSCYIYQLLRRPKLENVFIYMLHQFRLNQHFQRKNSVFWEHFLQNKNWLSAQYFVYITSRLIKNYIINPRDMNLCFLLSGKTIELR